MKLSYQQIEGFTKNFNPAQRAVLIYGPDHGLVQERAGEILARVLSNPDDAFAFVDLSGEKIKEDPALLFDEVSAMAFFGGRKVIRIREAAEKATDALKALLTDPPTGSSLELGFVLVLADDLPPKSSLRLLFESAKEVAALPCYHDEGAGIGHIIREEFRRRQIVAPSEVIAYLSDALWGDRLMVRMEMEKIDLFLGAERQLTIEMARACTEDVAESSLEEITESVSLGNAVHTEAYLQKAFSQGMMPVTVLRAVARQFLRFAGTATDLQNGVSLDRAMEQMRPKLFFKQQPVFRKQMSIWNQHARIYRVLQWLYQAELRIKTSGMEPELITRRILSIIARYALQRV